MPQDEGGNGRGMVGVSKVLLQDKSMSSGLYRNF